MDAKEIIYADRLFLPVAISILTIGDGLVLLAGLWTPVAGVLAVALSISEILVLHGTVCPAMLLTAMGAGLAVVGPGAFSVDAWLFGFKRIDLDRLQ